VEWILTNELRIIAAKFINLNFTRTELLTST